MTLEELRQSTAATVTIADTSSVLGVDPRTVSHAIANGELPAIKVGRRILIVRERLVAMLTVESTDEVA
jgi:excisionase family DNA binding protein